MPRHSGEVLLQSSHCGPFCTRASITCCQRCSGMRSCSRRLAGRHPEALRQHPEALRKQRSNSRCLCRPCGHGGRGAGGAAGVLRGAAHHGLPGRRRRRPRAGLAGRGAGRCRRGGGGRLPGHPLQRSRRPLVHLQKLLHLPGGQPRRSQGPHPPAPPPPVHSAGDAALWTGALADHSSFSHTSARAQ